LLFACDLTAKKVPVCKADNVVVHAEHPQKAQSIIALDDRAFNVLRGVMEGGSVMRNFGQVPNALWEVWRNNHRRPGAIAAGQAEKLEALVQFARRSSPWYRQCYHHLPADLTELHLLPPVTKSELMAHFNEWVTDPSVTREGVTDFLANKALVGERYLDRFAVWTTSGVSGKPGIFVHDAHALAVYSALIALRGYRWLTPSRLWGVLRGGGRYALVAATGEHFTLTDYMERIRRVSSQAALRIRPFSVLMPLPELVQALNRFQPAVLVGYPSIMQVLAQEQLAGRLHIAPILVSTGGECLSAGERAQIATAFGCLVRDNYGASEFMHIAFECEHERLHLNSDWVILEPVDEAYQPVLPGQTSHTTLLTNLANRVQPLIRYELGDRISISPDPCPCGSPLPIIQVEGRRDEILQMPTREGRSILLSPMALSTVIEETAGVQRFQVIQTGPTTLHIRLDAEPGANEDQVWTELVSRLRSYLAAQGIADVTLAHASERPSPHPASGKLRQVWAELPHPFEAQQQALVPSLTRRDSGAPPEEEPYQEEGD
jgi:phenylacetate-CoA ligase